MDAAIQLLSQDLVDLAVLIDAVEAVKCRCGDANAEVAFTVGATAGMSGMMVAFVDHLQQARRKGRFKLFCLQITYRNCGIALIFIVG